jgi:PAS domain S-box-containing protein
VHQPPARSPEPPAPEQEWAASPETSFIRVLQQLREHQTELELQNEALRQSQLELEQSRDRFVDFYEFSPVGYLTLTAKGVITDINLTGAGLLQLPRSQLVGQYFSRFLNPAQADFWRLHLKELVSQSNRRDCELLLQCGDGTQRHVRLDSLPLLKPNQPPSARIVMTDITERKRFEEALIQSEERWKFAIDGSGDGLWDWDIESGAAFYSPRYKSMLGFAEDEIGQTVDEWLKRIHPDDLAGVLARVQTYLQGQPGPVTVEFRMQCQDGSWKWILARGLVVGRHADGKPQRMIGTNTNITDRKLAEQALQEAKLRAEQENRAKSRFLAAASHDLRQPAHALGLFVAGLAALPNDAPTRQLVNGMDACVKAMQDMLDGFFNLSRLDPDSMQTSVTAFPIEAVFEQLRNSFASAASEKGLRLRVRPSLAWVQSDSNLLHRILLNLVSNALRYTEKGAVLVACRPSRDGRHVRLEVRDSGLGIHPRHHRDIFNEFFQLANPARDRLRGLGVGLSIVDRACRVLGYPLALRSALGSGSCFSLSVPLATSGPVAPPEASSTLPGACDLMGLNLLLIEDDIQGREGLAGLLISWGCRVTVANDARMACDLWPANQGIKLIISDFRLGGGINGIEAVLMLRELAGQALAACLISGDTDASVREEALAAGLTLMQKPVRPAKLRTLLRHLMVSQGAQV